MSPLAVAVLNDFLAHSGECMNHPEGQRPSARKVWHTTEGIAVPLCVQCEAGWTGDTLMGHTEAPLMIEDYRRLT